MRVDLQCKRNRISHLVADGNVSTLRARIKELENSSGGGVVRDPFGIEDICEEYMVTDGMTYAVAYIVEQSYVASLTSAFSFAGQNAILGIRTANGFFPSLSASCFSNTWTECNGEYVQWMIMYFQTTNVYYLTSPNTNHFFRKIYISGFFPYMISPSSSDNIIDVVCHTDNVDRNVTARFLSLTGPVSFNITAEGHIDTLDGMTQLKLSIYSGCTLQNIRNIGSISTALNLSNGYCLTHESLINVLNALTDRTDTTSLTLTLGTVLLSKLTAEEKTIAINKNWTLA